MTTVDRRTLIVGSAGLLLAACGGESKSERAKRKGPNIDTPDEGNVVRPEDTAALAEKLNAATKARDVEQLVAAIDPEDFALDDVRKRWTIRFENWERMGVVDGQWFAGLPGGRTRNAAGGLVEYSSGMVFAHTIKGCDAQGVVETFDADFRKKATDEPLELMHLGDAEARFDPSFWDVAKVDAIETEHAIIGFRTDDAKLAKSLSKRIEQGAAAAFDVMPRPDGVSKIFYALTWPKIDGKLWGGVAVGDADAHAYYHPFLDPEELAKGQDVAAGGKLPKATGRAGLHQSALSRPDFVEVCAHEGVHVLANQWLVIGDEPTPTWAVEGLATWASKGSSKLMSQEGGRIRANFREFEKIGPQSYDVFHSSPREYEMYMCSAAVYAYLDSEGDTEQVMKAARAFYGAGSRKAAGKELGQTEKELFTETRKWLGA